MKIYSDKLTGHDLHEALPKGVHVSFDLPTPARLRTFKFEHVRLSTDHGNRWPMSGNQGGGRAAYDSGQVASARAATYDEHGEWMAELFERDPQAIIIGFVRYDGREDFHSQTDHRYAPAPAPSVDTGYGVTDATPDGRWTFTRQSSNGGMTKAQARAEADRLNA